MNTTDTGTAGISSATLTPGRREAIKLGLATLAAMGISALSPPQAFATTGAMQYGASNNAGTTETSLASSNEYTFRVSTSNASGCALKCEATSDRWTSYFWQLGVGGTALWAACLSGSNTADAVLAQNSSANAAARGVKGYLANEQAEGCAVEGYTFGKRGATGVWGNVDAGGTGIAVKATTKGTGGALRAEITNAANNSTALAASTNGPGYAMHAKGAMALRVEGRMTMTRSGRAHIARRKSSVTVTVPGGLTTSANILCTAQDSAGTGVYDRYAKRVSSTQFKIQLNKACTSSVNVAWMVLG